jgi:lipoprotein NlpD
VRKGDTLYSIAWQAGHDYRKVARWNNIRWPYRIHPGQRISLKAKTKTKHKAAQKQKITQRKAPSKYKKKPYSAPKNGVVKWAWPTRGKIIGYFSAKEPGKKGVDIAGRIGQSIKAAASGRVVYSGNGLRGYGNLVIIKHNETYFSAYAHNRKIFVKENQKVKLGQKIADMGNTGANNVMLHFEIRRNGRPINPLKYLPKA